MKKLLTRKRQKRQNGTPHLAFGTREPSPCPTKKLLSLILVLAMALSFLPAITPAALAAETISGAGPHTIGDYDEYEIEAGATGTITIATATSLTLDGKGRSFTNLYIDASAVPGIELTLKDVNIDNLDNPADNTIKFSGAGNTLILEGENVITHGNATGVAYAAIHVPVENSTDLTVLGTGILYLSKHGLGAGFGADDQKSNGKITFGEAGKPGPTLFITGNGNGATIGGGGNTGGHASGEIHFMSGTYNLANIGQAAAIGGGGNTNSTGGPVFIAKDASVNIATDFNGAAIGGGASARNTGSVDFLGGSVRLEVTTNSGNWTHGVNNSALTAPKRAADGTTAVYLLRFDTELIDANTSGAPYVVKLVEGITETTIYSGGLHGSSFNRSGARSDPKSFWPLSTTADPNLYLYLPAGAHVLDVNGETFYVTHIPSAVGQDGEHTGGAFLVSQAEPWDGDDIDISWYDADTDDFTIYTAAQLAGLAAIVNNKATGSTVTAGVASGANVIDTALPADDFHGKTVTLGADIDLGGVEKTAGGLLIIDGVEQYVRPVWEGNVWTPIGNDSGGTNSGDGLAGRVFKGTFNGDFHKIYNIYIKPTTPIANGSVSGYEGNGNALFDSLGREGTVKNLIIASGYIRGSRFAAGVVGRSWGKVEHTANYATIETDGQRSGGGIVGASYGNGATAHIQYSFNAGLIMTGDTYQGGGIVGDNERPVSNSYNIGRGYLKGSNSTALDGSTTLSTIMMGIRGTRNNGDVSDSYSLSGDGMPAAVAANATNVTNSAVVAENEFMTNLKASGLDARLYAPAVVTVTFSVTPTTATVELKNSSGETINPNSGTTTYTLLLGGSYSYTVSAEGYQTSSDAFIASSSTPATINISLVAPPPPPPTDQSPPRSTVWDGKTIDVSWYNDSGKYHCGIIE